MNVYIQSVMELKFMGGVCMCMYLCVCRVCGTPALVQGEEFFSLFLYVGVHNSGTYSCVCKCVISDCHEGGGHY